MKGIVCSRHMNSAYPIRRQCRGSLLTSDRRHTLLKSSTAGCTSTAALGRGRCSACRASAIRPTQSLMRSAQQHSEGGRVGALGFTEVGRAGHGAAVLSDVGGRGFVWWLNGALCACCWCASVCTQKAGSVCLPVKNRQALPAGSAAFVQMLCWGQNIGCATAGSCSLEGHSNTRMLFLSPEHCCPMRTWMQDTYCE